MVLLVHLVRKAIPAIPESLEIKGMRDDLDTMENQGDVIMYQANQFHLVNMENLENQDTMALLDIQDLLVTKE